MNTFIQHLSSCVVCRNAALHSYSLLYFFSQESNVKHHFRKNK